MNVSAPFIHRPIATSLLGVAAMLGGLLGYLWLPVSALPQVEGSCAWALAVVALGTWPSPGDLDLEATRSLKRNGFRVICYEDGAPSWPLSLRCQLLLAGSSWLGIAPK